MDKTVCEKTAIALKNAGFPQPKDTSEGTWYLEPLKTVVYPWMQLYWDQSISVSLSNFSGAVFMPDVIDILCQLPNCSLVFNGQEWQASYQKKENYTKKSIWHKNPAEAVALLLLSEKYASDGD